MFGSSARKFQVGWTLVALLMAVVGCSDTTEPKEQLSQAEVEALVRSDFGFGQLEIDLGLDGLGTKSALCDFGGEVQSTYELVLADPLRLELLIVHRGCSFRTGGLEFTLDGAPSLALIGDLSLVGDDTIVLHGSYTGRVRWQLSDRSGSCDVDLRIDVTSSQNRYIQDVTGTACGKTVDVRTSS